MWVLRWATLVSCGVEALDLGSTVLWRRRPFSACTFVIHLLLLLRWPIQLKQVAPQLFRVLIQLLCDRFELLYLDSILVACRVMRLSVLQVHILWGSRHLLTHRLSFTSMYFLLRLNHPLKLPAAFVVNVLALIMGRLLLLLHQCTCFLHIYDVLSRLFKLSDLMLLQAAFVVVAVRINLPSGPISDLDVNNSTIFL